MDTIVAPITPMINSAVIVVRISGDNAFECCRLLKHKGDLISIDNIRFRYVYYGNFCDNIGNPIDNVIFYFFNGDNSYTGENSVEISFHGNPFLVNSAMKFLFQLGFRYAEPGEFTKRSFINGKLDLAQAESVSSLIESKTEKGVFYSFHQLRGSLSTKILDIKNHLVDISSIIEAYVDYPDDDITQEHYNEIYSVVNHLLSRIDVLIESYKKFRPFQKGLKISIVGKPNVGKSSLLNALLEYERSIVSDHPGTTRDFVDESIYIKGLPVNVIDTAGIRETSDYVENSGVHKSKEIVKDSDLVIVLLDISKTLDEKDISILKLSEGFNRLIIGNKSDIGCSNCSFELDMRMSVKYRTHFDDLEDLIFKKISFEDSDVLSTEPIINERHQFLLDGLKGILKSVLYNLEYESLDILSLDLTEALNVISEFTGEKYTEDILDNIFNKFCLGK